MMMDRIFAVWNVKDGKLGRDDNSFPLNNSRSLRRRQSFIFQWKFHPRRETDLPVERSETAATLRNRRGR